MWFSIITANLQLYKEQNKCGILFELENHNEEALKGPQEVIPSIHLVNDRFSYSYILPKKYFSNLLIKFPLLMDFPEGPYLCRHFTAIVTESFSYSWMFLLNLSILAMLHKVNRSLQQLFEILKTAFIPPLQYSLLYKSLCSFPFSDLWLVLSLSFRLPPTYPQFFESEMLKMETTQDEALLLASTPAGFCQFFGQLHSY